MIFIWMFSNKLRADLDSGNCALETLVIVETNFEASKTPY